MQLAGVKEFRPFNLCNVSYKIITKVATHKLWINTLGPTNLVLFLSDIVETI